MQQNYGNTRYPKEGGQRSSYPPSKNRMDKREEDFNKDINDRLGIYLDEILASEKKDYNSYFQALKAYIKEDADKISTSQLRNIFTQVKKAKIPKDLTLLRPKLAYVSGRSDKDGMRRLIFLFDYLIKQVKDEKQVIEFKNFFESIIAYHKYFGGKEWAN